MTRPGVPAPLILPDAPQKYDPANERETRRLIALGARVLPQWAALPDIPAPITALSALVGAADNVAYFTGVSTMALASLTPYARTILAAVDAAAVRTLLALGPLATLASPSDATKFVNGAASPAYAAVKDSDLALSNVTTNDVSITKHGFAPKAPNDATKYLDGTGAYSVPAGAATLPSFPVISNWELGYDALLSTTTQSGGLVTAISDISGNSRNGANGSTLGKPRYFQNAFNFKYPCWWFDGSGNDHINVTLPNLGSPLTVIIVMQDFAAGTGDGNIYRDQTARAVGYIATGNTWAIHGGTTGFVDTSVWTLNKATMPTANMTGAPAIRIDLYNGASSLICSGNTEITGGATGAATLIGGVFHIGNGVTPVTTAAKMMLRAFHIYSKALSLAERNSIRAYYADPSIAGILL